MPKKILFLTGTLAKKQLTQVLQDMAPDEFDWQVHNLGLKVAALMTAEMIKRRLTDIGDADQILLPGRCRGDLAHLSRHFGIPVERGPEELMDLPRFFGREGKAPDLSHYDVRIFAEIVDAPNLTPDAILERAADYTASGANVIDLGCLPETPFPHLEASIQALKGAGYQVSVDSMLTEELLRGGRAGADFLLSLHEKTLWVADQVDSIPILIPEKAGDLASLERAMAQLENDGHPYIADPILDPIHFGFTDSIVRYHRLRADHPKADIMMGVGNITELTEADTTGINAVLMGMISELHITNMLTTQVSPHCRSAVREADTARRIMHWARQENTLPKQVDNGLTGLHEMKPFPHTLAQIKELADAIRDPNFRIQISKQGIHLYNRDGLTTHQDPFDFFPGLGVEEHGGHAFYLGVELAKAQIAWQLGKRYVQDQPLSWGSALPTVQQDLSRQDEAGTTMKRRRKKS
ncbi:MAG: dihydropteroate synthase [Candidatus Thiodiazotropha sp. (ex Lucinoma kastoroae)]|nr:dihydropteroate synthase [Candidatus Thiodiazotropha sp. (ex Lucinoma kastoroae)]MCU7859586.1 dihydropteroate synthase [Candidatus Thiodiazotropha sp. (ex Lucinoma kastoroae)]